VVLHKISDSRNYAVLLELLAALQHNRPSFFRPGQIFVAQISSSVYLDNDRGFRNVDSGHLALEPTSELKVTAEQEYLEDRESRLTQIRNFPLPQMTLYSKELITDRRKQNCLLYNGSVFDKEEWAELHFQFCHWEYYFAMVLESNSASLRSNLKRRLKPRQEFAKLFPNSKFSGDAWIILDDISEDQPIRTNKAIITPLNLSRVDDHHIAGPVMTQRFVVIREGQRDCLCLGIHTYVILKFHELKY
jgi:hypothetical protein